MCQCVPNNFLAFHPGLVPPLRSNLSTTVVWSQRAEEMSVTRYWLVGISMFATRSQQICKNKL